MAFTNNLKKQVDIPVWEWCRLAPTASAALSATCTADNSLYHVSFGRYIYFMNSVPIAAVAAGYFTGFFRYDTITDTYQILNFPWIAPTTYTGMQFAGGQGYNTRVISSGITPNTIVAAALAGKTLKGFDIRITGGTGTGQQRIITDVSDPVIAYAGTVTTLATTPQSTMIDANANWVINQWAGYQVRFMHASGQTQTRKIIYNTSTTLYFSDIAKFAEDQWAWTPVFSLTGSPFVVTVAGAPYQIESSTITVDSPWLIPPDETSRFVVRSGGIWMVSHGAIYTLQYYDIAADQWYVRNACAALGPVSATASEATIVNSGENATVFERGSALGNQSIRNLQDTTKNWVVNQWAGYSMRIFSGTGEGKITNIISNTNNNLFFDPIACVDPFDITSSSGVSGAYTITTTTATPANCNGRSIVGTGIDANAVIVSGQGTTTLLLSVANTTTVTGTLTMGISATGASGAYTITTSIPAPQTCNGWLVSGTGIGAGALVVSGQGTTNLVLSVANSGTVSGIITMDLSFLVTSGVAGTYAITTSTTTPSNCNGWTVIGTGIAPGATIVSGQGTTNLVLSLPNIATVSGYVDFDIIPDNTSKYFIDAFEVGIVSYVNPPTPILASTFTATAGTISTPNISVSSATPANCNTWAISGTGITPGTTILSGQGTKNLVLSNNNTGAVSGILIISPTVISSTASSGTIYTYTVTTTTTPANCNGWYISGTGIGTGAIILSGQGTTTLTLSVMNTATFSSATLYLYPTNTSQVIPSLVALTATATTATATVTVTPTSPANCNGWYITGTNIPFGTTIMAGQGTTTLTISTVVTGALSSTAVSVYPPPTTLPAIATSTTATAASGVAGTYTITTSGAVPGNCNGWYITGTGIGAGATITSGQNTSSLTLSVANTATVSGTLTLSPVAVSTGSIVGTIFTAGATTGSYYPGQVLYGNGLSTVTTINSPAQACFAAASSAIVVFSAGTTAGIIPGMLVAVIGGTGTLTAATYVLSVTNSTTLVLSANVASAHIGSTLQFGPTFYISNAYSNGSTVLVASTVGLTVGMYVTVVSGTGVITVGTYITQIVSTNTFVVSQAPTTALGPAIIAFQPYQTVITAQLSGVTGGAGTYNVFPSQGTYSVTTPTTLSATGSSGSPNITTGSASPVNCNGWFAVGFNIAVGAVVVSGQGTTSLVLSINNAGAVNGTIFLIPQMAAPSVVTTPIYGAGSSILVDNTKNWPLNRWNNQVVRIKAGSANGDFRNIIATLPGNATWSSNATVASSVGTLVTLATGTTTGLQVGMVVNVTTSSSTGVFAYNTTVTVINNATQFTVSVAPTTPLASATVTGSPVNTLVTYPVWNTIPDSTSRYVIHGDPDKIYMSFGGQTPTFVHNIESDTVTQGRMIDYGVARGISAQYSDYPAVSLSTTVPSISVMPITSATGYVAAMGATTAASSASGVATILHTGGTFPVGSWITIATIVPAGFVGTWQVIASTPGSVSFVNATAGPQTTPGTIVQANSITIGGNLNSGAFSSLGTGTSITLAGCMPAAYNGTWPVISSNSITGSYGGYQSNVGATYSGSLFTVTSTTNLKVGMIPTITADPGSFAFATGTYISNVNNGTTFTVTPAPSGTLGANAVVSVIPSVAFTGTPPIPGNLITAGYVQKTPQAITAASRSGSGPYPCVLTISNTTFAIGSWIHVYNVTPGGYNGVFQVTASTNTTVTYNNPIDPGGAGVTFGLVGLATTTQLVTTVNNHNFKTGQYISHKGDTGFSAVYNNIVAQITTLPTTTTQYTFSVAAPSASMLYYGQSVGQLCDATKNWLPNQLAGCMVTYNSNQFAVTPTQPTVVAAYVVGNTSNTLIFGSSMTGYPPVAAVSRYVITAPATLSVQNSLGTSDSGLTLGVQTAALLQDVTKSWSSPGGTTGMYIASITAAGGTVVVPPVYLPNLYLGMQCVVMSSPSITLGLVGAINAIAVATNTLTISANFGGTTSAGFLLFGYGVTSAVAGGNVATILTSVSGLYVGMLAAVSLGSVTLPAGTTITAISGLIVTLSNNFGGTTSAATLSFTAPCNSSGNTITLSGYTTAGLAVGMYVGVLNAANLSVPVQTSGAFVANAGTNLTTTKVTSILSPTQFTVSTPPAVPLVNATVIASFWLPGMWNLRRVRLTSGLTANFTEAGCTGNNLNTLYVALNAVQGATGYSILQQPIRSSGTNLTWNFGASNLNTRGVYLYQARGGASLPGLPGWDRLDVRTDKWDFLMPTPSFEGLTVGAMYAYDGLDRIYFTPQMTQRVYYFDIENMTIHGASQYPYLAGTAVTVGNRMEIFETVDGLKYLWLNRHSGQECFKQLLFY